MYWFTSDTHFNHANIIEYCVRPFKSVTHMDAELIRRWNERVKPNDTVFHLGDFMFSKGGKRPRHYLRELNGTVVLIKGNHDHTNGLRTCVDSMTITLGGKGWWCQHRPEMLTWRYNLCGHVHNNWQVIKTSRYVAVNLSVEVWNYYPVNITEILKRLNNYENNNS